MSTAVFHEHKRIPFLFRVAGEGGLWLIRPFACAVFFICSTYAAADAYAQDAADENRPTIEEVIVTAQKRTERLQDVPVSVQVISGETLVNENKTTLEELTQTTPGVHISTGTGERYSNVLFIRGIGSGGEQAFDQSVAMFADGIYRGRSRMSQSSFIDLERIEILKGPQTTFFGNNAIAGALNIISRKPDDTFSANARLLYGDDGRYAVEGAVGGPITPTFGARLAVSRTGAEGWIENINTGEKVPKIDNGGARLTLAYAPNDKLDFTLKMEAGLNRLSGALGDQPQQYVNCPPPPPFPANFRGGCALAIAFGAPIGLDQNKSAGLPGQGTRLETYEGLLAINYRIGDHTLTSVSGYNRYDSEANADLFQLPVFIGVTTQNPEQYRQFSQELRLTSPTGGTFEYLAGLYYQEDKLTSQSQTTAPLLNGLLTAVQPELIPYFPIAVLGDQTRNGETYSAFGQLSWNATDRLTLGVALRGTRVEKDLEGGGQIGTGTQMYGGFVPLPAGVNRPFFLGPPGEGPRYAQSEDGWMPSAGVQYQLTPKAMTYLTYTRGYKAGGINDNNLLDPDAQRKFGPEFVDAWELGLKSTWLDDSLLLNVNLFLSDYQDLQVQALEFVPAAQVFFTLIRNVASSRSQGVEFEGQWAVNRNFRMLANVTYLDSKYREYPNASQTNLQVWCSSAANYAATPELCATVAPSAAEVGAFQDLGGQPTDYAPEWSGSVTLRHTMNLFGDYRLTTELSPFFTTEYFASGNTNDPFNLIDDSVRWDGRMSFEGSSGNWSIDVIGKNLTDEVIVSNVFLYSGTKLQPRNFAVQYNYRW